MSFSKEACRVNGDFGKYDPEDLLFKVLVVGDFGVGKCIYPPSSKCLREVLALLNG